MNTLDYLIIAAYLIGLLYMGYAFKKQSDRKGYFLAGRSLGWQPLSLSVIATQLSAISFVSAPAFVGLRENGGLIWLSYELAVPLAMLLLLWLVLPTLYRSGVVSVYDYLERRFDRSSRVLLSIVFQISRSFATGIMIYAVSIILQGTIGLAFWQSIVAIGVITLIYSLQGGMKAVVYGDALQLVIIVLGTLLCLGFGIYHIGGFDNFWAQVDTNRLQAVDFQSTGFDGQGFGFWPMIFGGIVLYASYYGCDQSEAQRSLSAKNPTELKKVVMAASLLRFPITLLYCAAGLVIGTFALTTPQFLKQIPADHPDWMMPLFIVNYLPNGVIGILLVAILAAAMSSLSSAINSLSAVSVEDYCRYTGKQLTNRQYLVVSRYAGLFWGVVTICLSAFAGGIAPTVIEAINKVGSLFYGPILACFLLAIGSKSLTAKPVNIGLIAGVLCNLMLWLFDVNIFWFWWNVTGFVTTIFVSYVSSIMMGTPKNDNKILGQKTDLTRVDVGILLGWFAVILTVCTLLSQ